jgi:hypothetical protein
VRLEKRLPWHRLAALGGGFQAVLGEDALDRVSSELVAEVAERATDPGVAPARVLGGELDDQALQRSGRAGPAALPLGGGCRSAAIGGSEERRPRRNCCLPNPLTWQVHAYLIRGASNRVACGLVARGFDS